MSNHIRVYRGRFHRRRFYHHAFWVRAFWVGVILASGLLPLAVGRMALACGVETDCAVPIAEPGRVYRIYQPESTRAQTGAVGAIVHAHGYRGTAAAVVYNAMLRSVADQLGVALIALKSAGEDWALPNSPSDPNADVAREMAYVAGVIKDATTRFSLDPNRFMASGFSAGGMMVWTIACHRSDLFAGFAPIAGTFWRPVPDRCTSPPTNIIHIHGDLDRVVPISGRPIGDTHQGDVMKALAMYQRYGDFKPRVTIQANDLRCEQQRNENGYILDFCQFSGGHSMTSAYLVHAWNRLRGIGALP
ncbi:MAG: PHB depolymerase family esterase [Pseudomonadota bacterium]